VRGLPIDQQRPIKIVIAGRRPGDPFRARWDSCFVFGGFTEWMAGTSPAMTG
jgi:hypothetical protein